MKESGVNMINILIFLILSPIALVCATISIGFIIELLSAFIKDIKNIIGDKHE